MRGHGGEHCGITGRMGCGENLIARSEVRQPWVHTVDYCHGRVAGSHTHGNAGLPHGGVRPHGPEGLTEIHGPFGNSIEDVLPVRLDEITAHLDDITSA